MFQLRLNKKSLRRMAMKLATTSKDDSGFSLIEIYTVIAIIGLLFTIAIPNYLRWKPNIELRSAARSLYTNMQKAKINAVKEKKPWAVIFDSAGNNYNICDDSGDGSWATEADNNCVEKFSLQFYGQGVRFGHGAATKPPTKVSFPGDNVSHINNRVEFTSRGLGNPGYVYLEHQQSTSSYAIGTTFVGGLKILRWGSDDWK